MCSWIAKLGEHRFSQDSNIFLADSDDWFQVVAYNDGFRPDNALELARPYDVIVDATDNASTRYLISDVCCILGKPLISGAAIGTEGQLSVYCYKDGGSHFGHLAHAYSYSVQSSPSQKMLILRFTLRRILAVLNLSSPLGLSSPTSNQLKLLCVQKAVHSEG